MQRQLDRWVCSIFEEKEQQGGRQVQKRMREGINGGFEVEEAMQANRGI